ncbi:MAG: TIGR01777 family oxidoreductase [Candidatus Korobacteraceae bacterium]
MRILISGASGLLGSAIRPVLSAAGYSSFALVRRTPAENEVQWDPEHLLDSQKLNGFDGIVHLAGKNIAGLWTERFKREIRASRVDGTRMLATAAAESFRATATPKVFIAASAIGYYGNRGDELLTEQSASGSGFLAEVCQEWENAARPAVDAGIRVVNLRIGVVLTRRGGALKAMLPAFRLGLGGKVGDGRQFMSWISLDDVVGAFLFALISQSLHGPVNVVAPQPVRNSEFVQSLATALHRPAIFPLPAFVVRTLFGEMGESLLLASARVQPAKLKADGYAFQHPELREALHSVLGRS